jgi:hypothetical protein
MSNKVTEATTTSRLSDVTTSQPEREQSNRWKGGIFSCIGSIICRWSFGSYDRVSSSEATSRPEGIPASNKSPLKAGPDGTPKVKSTWGYFTSLYHWAMGNTFSRVTDDTKLEVHDFTNDSGAQGYVPINYKPISMSGSYKVSDAINLSLVSSELKNTEQSDSLAHEDKERRCFVTEYKNKTTLFDGDQKKLENFQASITKISHQKIAEPIATLFREGDPPQQACFMLGVRKINMACLVNDENNEVLLTVVVNGHRNGRVQLYSADVSKNLESNDGKKTRKILSLTDDNKQPGSSTTTMQVKGSLNQNGSLNMDSLECLSIEGSWQIGSRSNKTVSLTTVGIPGNQGTKISVPRQGMEDIFDNATLGPATDKIREPITPSDNHSTFHADVARGYIHQGDDPDVTGAAFLKQFSKKIHADYPIKEEKLENDLMAHCHQGLFAGIRTLKKPAGSLFVLGGTKEDIMTTFKYTYFSAADAGVDEYPCGKIQLEIEKKVAQKGNALYFILNEREATNLIDDPTRNTSGTIFMNIDLKLQKDGGVTTIDPANNKSSLDATIQHIETSWNIR